MGQPDAAARGAARAPLPVVPASNKLSFSAAAAAASTKRTGLLTMRTARTNAAAGAAATSRPPHRFYLTRRTLGRRLAFAHQAADLALRFDLALGRSELSQVERPPFRR